MLLVSRDRLEMKPRSTQLTVLEYATSAQPLEHCSESNNPSIYSLGLLLSCEL